MTSKDNEKEFFEINIFSTFSINFMLLLIQNTGFKLFRNLIKEINLLDNLTDGAVVNETTGLIGLSILYNSTKEYNVGVCKFITTRDLRSQSLKIEQFSITSLISF